MQQLQEASANEAAIIAHHIASVLRRVDVISQWLQDRARTTDLTQLVDDPVLSQEVTTLATHFPEITSFFLFDADGYLASHNVFHQGAVYIGDRDYFLNLRAQPQSGLFFSNPVISRAFARYVVIGHRALLGPNHEWPM